MRPVLLATLLILLAVPMMVAETGEQAWLRYEHILDPHLLHVYAAAPGTVVRLNDSPVLKAAEGELVRGLGSTLRYTVRTSGMPLSSSAILLGTAHDFQQSFPELHVPALSEDGYWLKATTLGGHTAMVVAGANNRGALYGTFALLREITLHHPIDQLDETDEPYAPIRWVNEWDNLDGSVERGFGGRSIFFDAGKVLPDLGRVSEYARLLASVGINGCTVNNVNSDVRILGADMLPQLARLAEAFRPWGVRMSIAVPFASPKLSGDLNTFDPHDPRVQDWWKQKANQVYAAIPDLAGFVVKADSEGQAGPSTYGRTHADAANVLARALKPHGGILVYRAFVYNHHADWRDPKADRAKAAYDNFAPLDGKFDDNAVLQIKYGPIDFQAREPVSPLIAALRNTSQVLELQITQEYTGQQKHLCFLAPMWKQVLDFDMRVNDSPNPVKRIISGRTYHRSLGGFVGVSDVGLDSTWLGSDLAQANLYAFGRLAWNPSLSAQQIIDEWTRLTWGQNPRVVDTINTIQLASWKVYEGFTGPLGVGTLTDILHGHFGPNIESAERNGWGQWIRADKDGIGMERSVASGTGYIGQYPPHVASRYENVEQTPDELVLFMHHVPYSHRLHSGKTVIQHIYDSHYDAAGQASEFAESWRALQGLVDPDRYASVLDLLEFGSGHAVVWRDAICRWFQQESGLADERGRVGHYPDRIEAEDMQLDGYSVVDVTPWEDASGSHAVACRTAQRCSASYTFDRPDGRYDVRVQFFDENAGSATFAVTVRDDVVAQWTADRHLPSDRANGDTSVRKIIPSVELHRGDRVRLTGTPNLRDEAALDYIELVPLAPR